MEQVLFEWIDKIESDLLKICTHLFENPELGDQEFIAQEQLVNYLIEHDFHVETGLVERPTSFRATFKSDKEGPTIGIMAEYDALPVIGHGCGHNLIATMGIGAGILLSKVLNDIGGKVIVYGTPAEETNGAKVPMADAGLFDECDVAMMVHPAGISAKSGESLAMDAIEFRFEGKTSHAAASPEEGINALDSVIQLFNGINALRQHVKDDVRIHGVITEGGQAANVVPDLAISQFYIRAKERAYVNEVVDKVKKIAEGAALMTGATLAIRNYELSYDNMITNQTLSNIYTEQLYKAGETFIDDARGGLGSMDMGNVSHRVPAIHPYIGMGKEGLVAHTTEFRDQTMKESGKDALRRGALSMALTGYQCLTDQALLAEIKREFSERKK
ncbi:amidohydrolase [Halolactibacillus alkaliphilus]|uniref:Peptidase M20 domain-containing protein 2 n=1 Tax=Halolactibacillus alkaliphilus TaxID=442899 RepID=A0A511X3W1_9BACI|nr:M20 family metallopeptidase [Halolactibacillus alkaliphilus]GEN57638.1 amidohydrolase [Halolactibacillus alkaliphilus]GGN74485.1 amidohydrolase [Halolactibacillus alkaliphilus]SFP01930.1 amidohydrolase [Halolactibacillus alkaliphilus]